MRIALLSDIHEDVASLERALRKVGKYRCDEVVCLGDIAGFSTNYRHQKGRDAEEALRLVRENCAIIIAGNHDLLAARKTPGINPGYEYPDDWYSLSTAQQRQHSGGKVWLYEDEAPGCNLNNESLAFLRTLPEYRILQTATGDILLSHYAFPNLTGSMQGFYTHRAGFSEHLRWMQEKKCLWGFMGHAHVNGSIRIDEKELRYSGFWFKKTVHRDTCVVVPPVVKHKVPNGFCIFDTATGKLETKCI